MGYIDEQMEKNADKNNYKEFSLDSTVSVHLTSVGINLLIATGLEHQIRHDENGYYEMVTRDLFSLYHIASSSIRDISELIDRPILISNTFLKDVDEKNHQMNK